MCHSRSGNASGPEKARGEKFRKVGLVLHRVVQHQLGEPAILLVREKFVEFQHKARLFVQPPKTAHSFEVNADICEHLCSFADVADNVAARVGPEGHLGRFGQLDVDQSYLAIGKELRARIRFCSFSRRIFLGSRGCRN